MAPHLGILALGSYLSVHDVAVELIDVQIDFGFGLTSESDEIISQRIAQYLYSQAEEIAWIGISQLSCFGNGVAIAREIHALISDVPLIFGGYYASNTYITLLEAYPFITAIVRGDGEVAALQISRSLEQGRSFLSTQTLNLAWRDKEGIHANPIQKVSPDSTPILDFHLLKNPSNYDIINLVTSRGCPYRCNYCLEFSMRPYDVYSSKWIHEQLLHIKAVLPNDRIFIYDPVFGLGHKRTLEIAEVLGQHDFDYAIESRVDVLSPTLLPALSEAGIKTIYFGFESASESTLLRMNKLHSATGAKRYVAKAIAVLQTCFENEITPVIGFMLNFLGDLEGDYQESLDFIKEVSSLYDRIGGNAGFIPFVFDTKIYNGSVLEGDIPNFPQAIVEPGLYGETRIVSPSLGLNSDVARRYQADIMQQGKYTSLGLERLYDYFTFSGKKYVTDHPEWVDDDGVVTPRRVPIS